MNKIIIIFGKLSIHNGLPIESTMIPGRWDEIRRSSHETFSLEKVATEYKDENYIINWLSLKWNKI